MSEAGTLRRIAVCDFAVGIDKQWRLPFRTGYVKQIGHVVCCFLLIS
jgi:hypothetical protein